MRAIVVGCGSIGQRHLRNLRALEVTDVVVCDPDPLSRQQAAGESGATGSYAELDTALSREQNLDVALICSPSSMHLSHALTVAKAGLDLFVEKPLSHTLDGVSELLSQVEERRLILMVAMCYRFHPGLRKLKRIIEEGCIGKLLAAEMWAGSYLPDWHPSRDYRREYSAREELGGGVILDSIHSLDSLRWIFGDPVEITCRAAKVSDLEIDTEDIAAMIAVLASGAIVEIHVDYLQRPPASRIEVVGSQGKAVWDGSEKTVAFFSIQRGSWERRPYSFDANDMYVAELEYFLACVRSRRRPATDGASGLQTLQLAMAAKRASLLQSFVSLNEPHEGEAQQMAVAGR